jgi:DNA-binding response OmpR family regulator
VLIIDDEADIADVLRDTLAAEGHAVEVALSGAEGLAKLDENGFDVVFTDLGMPDMSGWEVAAEVRARHPDTPVVLVTGWGASLDDDEVRRNGVAAVVHKPFEIDHLVATAGRVLLRSSAVRDGRDAADDGEGRAALP